VAAIAGDREFITFKDVVTLKEKIREDLFHYEFSTYEPDEQDTIPIENFLRSLIPSFSSSRRPEKLLREIKKIVP